MVIEFESMEAVTGGARNIPFYIFLILYSIGWGAFILIIFFLPSVPVWIEEALMFHAFPILAIGGIGFVTFEVFLLATKRQIKRTSIFPLLIELVMWVPIFLFFLGVWFLAGGMEAWGPS